MAKQGTYTLNKLRTVPFLVKTAKDQQYGTNPCKQIGYR